MRARALPILIATACGGDADSPVDAPVSTADAALGVYRGTCDGSGIVALDATHFLDINDEDSVARIYTRGTDGEPVLSLNLGPGLGIPAGTEGDLEEAARVGDRIYMITSHSRRSSGMLDRARYHFGAFDLAGSAPTWTLTPAGATGTLLDDIVDAANWDNPDSAIINALDTASKLDSADEPTLAAEASGTNIEGMTSDGQGHLLIGFRNPQATGAIVVALANPDDMLTGASAHVAWGAVIDLGAGRGVRAMTWSQTENTAYVVGGPIADAGTFALYRWNTQEAPALVQMLGSSAGSPESLAFYPGSTDLQVGLDGSSVSAGATTCKDAAPSAQLFRDLVVALP